MDPRVRGDDGKNTTHGFHKIRLFLDIDPGYAWVLLKIQSSRRQHTANRLVNLNENQNIFVRTKSRHAQNRNVYEIHEDSSMETTQLSRK